LGPRKATGAKGVLAFVNDGEDYDPKKEYPRLSLDQFYESLTQFKLSDKEALDYMTFAAKMAAVRFKTQEELF